MDNNVVMGLFERFASAGYVTLAFNFRGVGRSGGRSDGQGGEVEDVAHALEYLTGLDGTKGCGLGLLGYSYGAWAGLQLLHARKDIRCAGVVAPPTGMLPFAFLSGCCTPVACVSGDRDPYCPADRKESFLALLQGEKAWTLLPGTDHFLWGREREAADILYDAFRRWLPVGP